MFWTVIAQAIMTMIVGAGLLVIDNTKAISYIAASSAVVVSAIIFAINIKLTKYMPSFFWIAVLVDKLVTLLLLFIAIVFIKEPSYGAFLTGIIVTTLIPLVSALFLSVNKGN